ncbi:unnamed protein product [Meloidogyne enterolobii]|uniref:Uncharacterized protein n=1 Tax=Meloidogyne enterolobii TaxID=390850 RepID=A0ACB0Z5R4_MELEN
MGILLRGRFVAYLVSGRFVVRFFFPFVFFRMDILQCRRFVVGFFPFTVCLSVIFPFLLSRFSNVKYYKIYFFYLLFSLYTFVCTRFIAFICTSR